jgi:hypothetical protein
MFATLQEGMDVRFAQEVYQDTHTYWPGAFWIDPTPPWPAMRCCSTMALTTQRIGTCSSWKRNRK